MPARFRETEQTKETRTTKQNEQTGEILKNVWFLLPRGGLRIWFIYVFLTVLILLYSAFF